MIHATNETMNIKNMYLLNKFCSFEGGHPEFWLIYNKNKYISTLYFIHTDKYTLISILCATNETMHIKIWMYFYKF